MKTSNYFNIAILTVTFSFALLACSNQYSNAKTITSSSKYPAVIERARKDQRYFILRSGINIYNVTSLDLDRAKQQMTVTLDKVDSSHLVKVKNSEINSYKPQKEDTSTAANIYLYMKDSTSYTLDEPHTIPLDKVQRVELFDK